MAIYLAHVDIVCRAIDDVLPFYVQGLSGSVFEDTTVEGGVVRLYFGTETNQARLVFVKFQERPVGHSFVELIEPVGSQRNPSDNPSTHRSTGIRNLAFVVKSVEDSVRRAVAYGGTVISDPEVITLPHLGKHRVQFVRGPDDVIVEFSETLQP
jgi:catechol 2,3-dioxygenase-like lactoylglutathione lyase family enzyme